MDIDPTLVADRQAAELSEPRHGALNHPPVPSHRALISMPLRAMLATREAELADLRRDINATAAVLGPTPDGPDSASGTLFYAAMRSEGVLLVEGMEQLAADRVYQLWYLRDNADPQPGPTFRVDEEGRGTAIISSDVPTFDGVAITQEPENGSETPTDPILMIGELGGARG